MFRARQNERGQREAESSLSLKLVGFSKGSHQEDSQQATNPETHGNRGQGGVGRGLPHTC